MGLGYDPSVDVGAVTRDAVAGFSGRSYAAPEVPEPLFMSLGAQNLHVTGSLHRPSWIQHGDEQVYDELRADYFRRQNPNIGNISDFVDDQRTQAMIDEYLREEYENLKREETAAKAIDNMRDALASGKVVHDLVRADPEVARRIPGQIDKIEKRAKEESEQRRSDILAREDSHVQSIAAAARDRGVDVQAGVIRARGTDRAVAVREPAYEGGYGPVAGAVVEHGRLRVPSRDRGAIEVAGRPLAWSRKSKLPPAIERVVRDPARFEGGTGRVGGEAADWR